MQARSRPPRDLHATTVVAKSERREGGRPEPDVTALVIAWYPHDPRRTGELAVIPKAGSPAQGLGRGTDDKELRVRFFRSRPGRLEPTEPLASPGLSRRQLEIQAAADGVHVRRVGQCPMRVNGVECDAAVVRPGDTIRLRQELVLLGVRRAARPTSLRHLGAEAWGPFGEADRFGIVGESPAVWALRDAIAFAARAEAHVLLTGESGTGKELAARAIHGLSRRSKRALVSRNAATMPAGLIDAELFGNVRNYPNAGMPERPGLIGQAHEGLLFLDEIGELPLELQARLLRILDEGGEYQRLGEATPSRSDFRLLAATNRDPDDLKHDLLARLTVRIELPSLAQRREDIPLLARHLALRAAERSPDVAARFVAQGATNGAAVRVDAKLVDELLHRDYPGNTRSLEAVVWAAMASSDGDTIAWSEAALATDRGATTSPPAPRALSRGEEPAEQAIRAALAKEDGHVARAAHALGLSSRYALYRLMAKIGIESKG